MSVGVPIKVLHDAEGHIVTIETIDGNVFRGKLMEAEDNMNVYLTEIVMTTREGRTINIQSVYIRGSKIRFLILPDMLKNSPMLKKPQMSKGVTSTKSGMGRSIRGRGGFRGPPRGPGRGFR